MLHDQLKQARLAAGMTMDVAGERIGVSQSTLSRMEMGVAAVSSQRLIDMASAYGVSPSALLEEAVVRSISDTDLENMGLVIELVERALAPVNPRPSPQKIADIILVIFKKETASVWETGAAFDISGYEAVISAMLTGNDG